jgi:hypothetical protein
MGIVFAFPRPRAIPVFVSNGSFRHLNKITMFYHFDIMRAAGQSEMTSFLVGLFACD